MNSPRPPFFIYRLLLFFLSSRAPPLSTTATHWRFAEKVEPTRPRKRTPTPASLGRFCERRTSPEADLKVSLLLKMSGLAAAVAALLGILIVVRRRLDLAVSLLAARCTAELTSPGNSIRQLYTLLVHFSPRDPIEHDSEATYCTAADPENPLPLARLFHPDADTASKDRPSVKLSVVVPAYNESKRIEVMLRPAVEFLETRPVDTEADGSYELLIVDDGSTDGTSEKALKIAKQLEGEFGAKRGQIKVCRLIRNRGKGGATKHVRLFPARVLCSDLRMDIPEAP